MAGGWVGAGVENIDKGGAGAFHNILKYCEAILCCFLPLYKLHSILSSLILIKL